MKLRNLNNFFESIGWNASDDEAIKNLEAEIKELEKEQKSITREIALNRNSPNGTDYIETELQADLIENKNKIAKLYTKLKKYRAMKRERLR